MAYLVDSDILIDASRGNAAAAKYLNSLGDWSVSVVTGMELVAGAKNKSEVGEIDIMLATYRSIPLSEDIGQPGYNLMKSYAKSNGLEPPDALIAATAMHEGLKLSTLNRKHFGSIGGLEIEVPEY
jgi:predicted nucleic acid-binding protein